MLNLNKLYKRAQGHSTMEKQKKIASCITIGRGGELQVHLTLSPYLIPIKVTCTFQFKSFLLLSGTVSILFTGLFSPHFIFANGFAPS